MQHVFREDVHPRPQLQSPEVLQFLGGHEVHEGGVLLEFGAEGSLDDVERLPEVVLQLEDEEVQLRLLLLPDLAVLVHLVDHALGQLQDDGDVGRRRPVETIQGDQGG